MLLCNMACDTGDYRFPMSNLFRKQITSGFEETHIHYYQNGPLYEIAFGREKKTDRQYKKIQKKSIKQNIVI